MACRCASLKYAGTVTTMLLAGLPRYVSAMSRILPSTIEETCTRRAGRRTVPSRRLRQVDADGGRVDAAGDVEVECPAAMKRMVPLRAHRTGMELELQPQADHL